MPRDCGGEAGGTSESAWAIFQPGSSSDPVFPRQIDLLDCCLVRLFSVLWRVLPSIAEMRQAEMGHRPRVRCKKFKHHFLVQDLHDFEKISSWEAISMVCILDIYTLMWPWIRFACSHFCNVWIFRWFSTFYDCFQTAFDEITSHTYLYVRGNSSVFVFLKVLLELCQATHQLRLSVKENSLRACLVALL